MVNERDMMINKKPAIQIFRMILWIIFFWITNASAQSVNTVAPPFTGTLISGETVCLSDYQGKVVLLDIWASWCGPCQQEMPFLVESCQKFGKDGFVVLTINIDKDVKNIRKFVSKLEIPPDFPIVLDQDAKIPPLYQVEGMPTTLLIDRKGMVRYRHIGFKPENKDSYLEEITTLLKEKTEL